MGVLTTSTTSLNLWHDVIKHAEHRCDISLDNELESYLISLLVRYMNRPDVAKKVLATAFLEALKQREMERHQSLQNVGDQCLLFAGLFPRVAEKRHVKINYFVDLGRAAYTAVSKRTNDLFGSLSVQFVVLMDVLQSIREHHDLMPLEAYEQWDMVGSQRAFKILQDYTKGTPFKKI